MAVGFGEALDRRAGEEERLQNSLVDDGDAAGLDSLVIEAVSAVEIDSSSFAQGWVGIDGDEVRQHTVIEELFESLALFFAFIAVALKAVTEDFMEEESDATLAKLILEASEVARGEYNSIFED